MPELQTQTMPSAEGRVVQDIKGRHDDTIHLIIFYPAYVCTNLNHNEHVQCRFGTHKTERAEEGGGLARRQKVYLQYAHTSAHMCLAYTHEWVRHMTRPLVKIEDAPDHSMRKAAAAAAAAVAAETSLADWQANSGGERASDSNP